MIETEYESIVTVRDKPTLVLAGPGAGKTYLLADRVKRLLDSGVSKDEITVLTFNKDANQNLRNKLLDPKDGFNIKYSDLPRVLTHHSFGFEIINRKPHGVGLLKTNLRVQANDDIKLLLFRDAALILGLNEEHANRARMCKEEGDCDIGNKGLECSICEKYREIMSKCNYIDFDDQILLACYILENDSELLKEYQSKTIHLLVDEYQDINAAQFRLIELLSRNSRNGLFAVGDDAQSIYSFRGSDPKFILRFDKDFPGAYMPPYAHSRRCPKQIMLDASRVLKTYYADWTGPFDLKYRVTDGENPKIMQVTSDKNEAIWVARIAREAVSEKKTVLILAPKKEFFPRISRELGKFGVPHQCPTNMLPYSSNKRLQVLFRLIEWAQDAENNFSTRIAIESLINNGKVKVKGADKDGKSKPETIKVRIEVEKQIALLWESVSKQMNLLSVLNNKRKDNSTLDSINATLLGINESYNATSGKLRSEYIKCLSDASAYWNEPDKFGNDLIQIRDILSADPPSVFGSVRLMTMKKAKGLEANVVIMVGLENDIMPNPKSKLDEEARLFYVSMTRASEKLYMIHSLIRLRGISYGKEVTGKGRSKFLDTIGRKSKYRPVKRTA
ncbi:ATP-dependent helicase [bacterium]|nr:ATP-dependent helicase [bacterium]